jgi:magnesium transporter
MLTLFHSERGELLQSVVSGPLVALPSNTVWLDLFQPTKEEERQVEACLGAAVPTREEMQEIEASSRLYVENDALVMTLPILNKSTTDVPESSAVTFMIVKDRLVTVRYDVLTPFTLFLQRLSRQPSLAASGEAILLGLLEQVTDRLADILESATADIEKLSHVIFGFNSSGTEPVDFEATLCAIGHIGDITTRAKDCLMNFSRLLPFWSAHRDGDKVFEGRIKTLSRDAQSVDEHAAFLSNKISFMLDATLGMINIEQNNIIKIFSIAAVAFLPPTLIASIYGMNFDAMPELKWAHGYQFALLAMIVSALLPFWYFRKKKWL